MIKITRNLLGQLAAVKLDLLKLIILVVGLVLISPFSGDIFGLTDNGVLLICAYIGLNFDENIARWLVHRGFLSNTRAGLGVIVGALVGNTLSDAMGALADPAMHDKIIGIIIGCLIPLVLLPVTEKIYNKMRLEND
jgi:uncharacterized membrane protein YeaQ/YmgE (transglycosylase-associated protein family)